MNKKNKPKSSDFLDRMIEHFTIKESLELKRDIQTFTNYWTARYFFAWCLVMVAWCLTFHLWGVFSSWGWCDPLDIQQFMAPFLLSYMAVLPGVVWAMGYHAICNRLTNHVKVLAGVEDADN